MAGHASSFTVLADRLVKRGGRVALVLPVTALSGESWRGIREMLASRYEVEFVVSSHDPDMRSMSYDTGIAETLIVARRLNEGESPSRRGKFVNLWRAARSETDALALVSAVNSVASRPVLSSDGPPVGGSPLMVGGEQWGEVVEGPVGESAWKAARWKHALIGQFAAAVERGELWTEDGTSLAGQIRIAAMAEVCNVGPQHRRIRGSLGVFDGYHGYNEQAQFAALWSLNSEIHQGMISEPNAWLIPKPDREYAAHMGAIGTLQLTCDVRYNAQRIMATLTSYPGIGSFVLASPSLLMMMMRWLERQREVALAMWCNSHHRNIASLPITQTELKKVGE